MPELRQRQPRETAKIVELSSDDDDDEVTSSTPTLAERAKEEDSSFSLLDIARSIVFVLLLTGATSYFITRTSLTWNVSLPRWTRPEVIQAWIKGPIGYTEEELKAFDGTDPEKPLLLAINGTVYDVSNGRRHYGPGGSYHLFAGADASRAFVTGCFKEDITGDMRGVEEMFLPLDDPSIDSQYTSGQLKALREQEARRARSEVDKALRHWVDFFANSKKYHKVGHVKRKAGWPDYLEKRELCDKAKGKRKPRNAPGEST